MIKVTNVTGGYDDSFQLQNIHFEVKKGEFFGIIGPNGSGKTTLVKMLSNILFQYAGEIVIDRRNIQSYRPKELARKLAVLPQLTEQSFRFTVREIVAIGRYAHQSHIFGTLSQKDERIINEVMEYTDVDQYEHITIDQLSGGERQRVFLAQALAQEPEIIILDEPTNHLDLAYQKELLDLLKSWTIERELTVVAIFHDLNLASLYCDRLLLLNNGKVHICDLPNKVLQHKHILEVYRIKVENKTHPAIPKMQIMLTPERYNDHVSNLLIEQNLFFTDHYIAFHSPIPLKTLSNNDFNDGNGWYKYFLNCYNANDNMSRSEVIQSTKQFLQKNNYEIADSIVTVTSVNLNKRSIRTISVNNIHLSVIVTASDSHAVDATMGRKHMDVVKSDVGTINTWIFIDGKLTDFAFVQGIVTATEAKAKALQNLNVKDEITGTIATGSPTDTILIAATQEGPAINSANSISELGVVIGEIVFECIVEAMSVAYH